MSVQFYDSFAFALVQNRSLNSPSRDTKPSAKLIVGADGYEGGLEEWLCSEKLTEYINSASDQISITGDTLRVLELGCGAANPGTTLAIIRAQLNLPTELYLQEIDRDAAAYTMRRVAERLKISNVHYIKVSVFVSTWANMSLECTPEQKFDIILMAETLYRTSVFEDMQNLLSGLLKPNGVCWSAQKKYYFGLGGGAVPFESFASQFKPQVLMSRILRESIDTSPSWSISALTLRQSTESSSKPANGSSSS